MMTPPWPWSTMTASLGAAAQRGERQVLVDDVAPVGAVHVEERRHGAVC